MKKNENFFKTRMRGLGVTCLDIFELQYNYILAIKTNIIKIGNSRGIRLPKVILQQIGINDEVDLEVDRDRIVLKPVRHRRSGWREVFRKMAAKSDDRLLDGEETIFQSSWDEDEWTWENE